MEMNTAPLRHIVCLCSYADQCGSFFCAQSLGMTGPPPSQSLSRQRTTSSSSSTHSQHTVGSLRRGSTPGLQASNHATPRSSRHASLTGGGGSDHSAQTQTPQSACRADSVFQFGVPPRMSSAYTVCFALHSVTSSFAVLLLTHCILTYYTY